MSKENKVLLTTKEVAKMLNVAYHTIRARMKDGRIPYININKGGLREVARFDPDVIKGLISGR